MEDLPGCACFSQARKDVLQGPGMRFGAQVGHGIDGEGDMESELVGLARGGFDSRAGGHSGKDDLGDAFLF